MGNKILSYFTNGIMAGFLLSIGCTVSMFAESKFIGAFLFSLGLFAIITFKFGLFTGKAGYMAVKPPIYILDVLFTFLGNTFGAAISGFLLNYTKFANVINEKSVAVISAKFNDSLISIFILSVFCGILMFVAVDGNKRNTESNNFIGALFITVLPVIVFILCGFNHCVADMAYFMLSKCAFLDKALIYFPIAILGNAFGCMIIPLVLKIINYFDRQ